MKTLRWHISRVYDDDPSTSDDERYVEVTISPSRGDLQVFTPSGPNVPIASDRLDWWIMDEEAQIEGWTWAGILLRNIRDRNARRPVNPEEQDDAARRLVEDMVFLQFVKDAEVAEHLTAELQSKTGLPEVTALAELDGATWLDYTQPARAMSADLYRQVLGTEESSKDASE